MTTPASRKRTVSRGRAIPKREPLEETFRKPLLNRDGKPVTLTGIYTATCSAASSISRSSNGTRARAVALVLGLSALLGSPVNTTRSTYGATQHRLRAEFCSAAATRNADAAQFVRRRLAAVV
jgi:hypothetical protein